MKRTKSSANKPAALPSINAAKMTPGQRRYLMGRIDEMARGYIREHNETVSERNVEARNQQQKLIDKFFDGHSDAKIIQLLSRRLKELGAMDPDKHRNFRASLIGKLYTCDAISKLSGAADITVPGYMCNSDSPELTALKDEIMLGESITSLDALAERIAAIFAKK